MAFQTWGVEGARHNADVLRVLAHAAHDGKEGITEPPDWDVQETEIPSGDVRIMPGAGAIINRATGKKYQAYQVSSDSAETLAIPPNVTLLPRTDLIVIRVENPTLEAEWENNPLVDPELGPWAWPRRYPGVDPATWHVEQVDEGASALTLARILIPAETATITQSMITDLRSLRAPIEEEDGEVAVPSAPDALSSSTFVEWPQAATRDFRVPVHATKAKFTISVTAAVISTGAFTGEIRAEFGSIVGATLPLRADGAGATVRQTWGPVVAADVPIPQAMRGTDQEFRLMARRTSGTGVLTADTGTIANIRIDFGQIPIVWSEVWKGLLGL